MDLYLGYTTEYWLALQKRADTLDCTSLIDEIAYLRSKLSYYESRISAMANFKDLMESRDGR